MADKNIIKPEEQKALTELRALINETPEGAPARGCDEFLLLRFVRARKLKAKDAFESLLKTLKWREESKCDSLIDVPLPCKEIVETFVPFLHSGFDKQGRPIYWERTGLIDCPRLRKTLTDAEFIKVHIWFMERCMQRCRESTEKKGSRVSTFNYVADMKGTGVAHRKMLDWFKLMSEIDREYYPEVVNKTYIINAPWYFHVLWAIAKNFIDPETRTKFIIYSGNGADALLADFGAENVPKEYGGSADAQVPTPDEAHRKAFFETARQRLTAAGGAAGAAGDEKEVDETAPRDVTVGSRSSFKVDLETDVAHGACFTWDFTTKAHDIGFAVDWFPAGADAKAVERIVPAARQSAHKKAVRGSYLSKGPGKLVLMWDNSFSMFTSKVLTYSAYVSVAPAPDLKTAGAADDSDQILTDSAPVDGASA